MKIEDGLQLVVLLFMINFGILAHWVYNAI